MNHSGTSFRVWETVILPPRLAVQSTKRQHVESHKVDHYELGCTFLKGGLTDPHIKVIAHVLILKSFTHADPLKTPKKLPSVYDSIRLRLPVFAVGWATWACQGRTGGWPLHYRGH